ncbi:MarR family transcriptional regulator [Nonomuraea mesophila]|uniref:MarR family transcriptional regulator n=1 Tax=Nonomuraea mesophila TaxID=2530382 RepID=A0A4R5FKD1_9ACTN|nr:MarR family transcriptional regulator [Nonomuraea mesophila]
MPGAYDLGGVLVAVVDGDDVVVAQQVQAAFGGITVVQAEATLILADDEPLTLGELGARLIAETGNPSRLVDRLHSAGLVHRHPSAHDRRHVELTLTSHGREMATRIQEARRPLLEWGGTLLDDTAFAAATTALRRVLHQP